MRTRTRTGLAALTVLAATVAVSAATTVVGAPAASAASATRTAITQEDPGPAQPGPAQPSPAQPGLAQPSHEQPGPEQPGPEQPGPEQPSPAQPGPEQPSPAQPAPAEPVSRCSTTAAEQHGWGEPDRHSDFEGIDEVPPDWHPYGPEPGHAKNGIRTPDAVTVADGVMSITADAEGTTGAVSWHPGQRHGRWEACVKSDEASGGLNALLLLWPVAEDFPVGGEIDWMEILSDDRQETSFFLHYGPNNDQDYGATQHDSTEWSSYALEWTPEKMTAYVDGEEWYTNTNTDHFPPRPMNMTMQLDYFPPAGGPTAMHMDWASQWAIPESEPATLSLPPGANATGQPRDYPERAPRELTPDEQQAQDAMLAGE
ncbi:glycoside hydrolase family 16 protein [Pseudonocardia kongjuensis]|uniref:glycoside hydrolase family 16 protein n=1 Tax=Pseudonocardia kongjuensis TaxID=102227 RepID=UPI0031D56A4B